MIAETREATKMTILEFVEKYDISCTSESIRKNRNIPNHRGNHFLVTLHRSSGILHDPRLSRIKVPFSKRYGLVGSPTLEEVLDCLAADSEYIEAYRDFESWARDIGFDPNDQQSKRVYKLCIRQANMLQRFLGKELYKILLWEVER